jgi:transmembrane sensor
MTERLPPDGLLPVREADWNAARSERALQGVKRRVLRARRRDRLAVVAFAAASVLVALLSWRTWTSESSVAGGAQAPSGVGPARPGELVLADGSRVVPGGGESKLAIAEQSRARVVVELLHGTGRFEVEKSPERQFIVEAGPVTVVVVGTVFSVTRQGARVRVSVERGRVRVSWPSGSTTLQKDESGWYPPEEPVESVAAGVDPGKANDLPEPGGEPGEAATPPSARARFLLHHKNAEYQQAYQLLRDDPSVLGSSAKDLMIAADAARLSGHPNQAAQYLDRVASEYRGSGQAPLAAFTLGRIYLYQLGRPAQAAKAFQLARQLAPSGALAHDALARQVEAVSRASGSSAARPLAEQYVKQYPSGRRIEAVRRFGGIE